MQRTQAQAAFLIRNMRKCHKFCSFSQSGKSCSTSRKELKNCVSEAPSTRGATQNLVPLLRRMSTLENLSWQRTNLRPLQHRHAADREVSDPTESASTSAVRSSSIFLAATLRCVGRMIVLHTRQHARKEDFEFEKPHQKHRNSLPLEKNRRDSESFG